MHPDLMIATLTLMKSFGTVVDVGKRLQTDGAGHVNLFAPFVRGLTYTTAHLDELMRVHPAKVCRILDKAVALRITLPLKSYRLSEIDDALSFLSSGKHTGKVVVELPLVIFKDNPMGPKIDIHMDRLDNAFELQREISRIFPEASEIVVRGLDQVDFHQSQQRSVWIDSSLSSKSVLSALRRIHAPVSGHLVVVSPAKLVGEDPVPRAFREIRNNALSTLSGAGNVKGSESAWIQTTIASMIGKPKLGDIELSSSLEQLGIDSLGRLQLWHAFKRQFPHSRLNQFGSTVSLSHIFCKDHSAEKYIKPTRKWLAIHGFRTSPDVLQHQLAELIDMFLSDAKVDFVQAPHAARGPCPHGGEGFEWWSAVEDDSYEGGWIGDVGLDESIEILRQRIASTGPYDGVIGFSQGAGMAHHLAALGLVAKAILISPVAPTGRSWPASSHDSSVSVIVLRDPSDKSVDGYPIDGIDLVLHSQGHAIPHMQGDVESVLRRWLS
jgi:predicted esterase